MVGEIRKQEVDKEEMAKGQCSGCLLIKLFQGTMDDQEG